MLAAPSSSGPDGNPYIDLLYAAVRARGARVASWERARLLRRPDVVHLHWPELLLRWELTGAAFAVDAVKVLALVAVARARGAVVVLTVHNLPDDTRGTVVRHFVSAVTALTDHVISLSAAALPAIRAAYPRLRDTPVTVVAHGHYRDAYPAPGAPATARRALGLPTDARIALCLGQIRAYKALVPLAEAFLAVAGPGQLLVFAGEPVDAAEADRLRALAADPRLHLDLRRIPETEVSRWHSAADVVVLPHRGARVLNSGAAVLALSLGRPFVAAESEVLRELQDLVGSPWVALCDGTPAQLVAAATATALPTGRPDLAALAWPELGGRTVEAYESAVRQRRSGRLRRPLYRIDDTL